MTILECMNFLYFIIYIKEETFKIFYNIYIFRIWKENLSYKNFRRLSD